jgi:hypothetical protein
MATSRYVKRYSIHALTLCFFLSTSVVPIQSGDKPDNSKKWELPEPMVDAFLRGLVASGFVLMGYALKYYFDPATKQANELQKKAGNEIDERIAKTKAETAEVYTRINLMQGTGEIGITFSIESQNNNLQKLIESREKCCNPNIPGYDEELCKELSKTARSTAINLNKTIASANNSKDPK